MTLLNKDVLPCPFCGAGRLSGVDPEAETGSWISDTHPSGEPYWDKNVIDCYNCSGTADKDDWQKRTKMSETKTSDSWYTNYYKCGYDGEEWQDTGDCTCNDRCPVCDKEIPPYKSEEIEDE